MTRTYQDSYAPIMYDVQYDQYGTGAFVRFPIQDMFQSLSIHRVTAGAWTGTLNIFDRFDNDANRSFLMGQNRPSTKSLFKIRWWWNRDADGQKNAPTFFARALVVRPTYAVEGAGLTIDITAANSLIASMDKDLPPREFPAGMTATEIVKEVCAGLGWPIELIQDSYGKSPNVYRMGGESHQEFVMQKILPWAHDANNDPFQFYWGSNGGLHFHSASYVFISGKGSNGNKVAREYVAYADMQGEVESFQVQDNSTFTAMLGGGDGVVESIDSKNKTPVQQVTSLAKGVTNTTTNTSGIPPATPDELHTTDQQSSNSSAPNPAKPPASAFTGVVARTPEEANRYATTLYGNLRHTMYRADMQVVGTHGILPNDYVAVRYYTWNGLHYLSGQFQVLEITDSLGSGGWKTNLALVRQGTKADGYEKTIEVITAKTINPKSGDNPAVE